MNKQRLSGPRPGIVTRLVAGVTGLIVLAGAFVLGVVAWVILAGCMVIGAFALSIWVWRQRRRFEKYRQQSADSVIDVEYEVIDQRQDPPDPR